MEIDILLVLLKDIFTSVGQFDSVRYQE